MSNLLWTREQVLIALNLYCQMPFGQFHSKNPIIIEFAHLLGRTPNALAMKLANLASLDPRITHSGRKGLANISHLDKQIWLEYQANPEAVGYASQQAVDELVLDKQALATFTSQSESFEIPKDFSAEDKESLVKIRVKQAFFRKAVLGIYASRCCMTGLTEPRLLIASHIIPWSKAPEHRLNPGNGLCLSALHDKAYDQGLLTVTPEGFIKVSPQLKVQKNNNFLQDSLVKLDHQAITLPINFKPNPEFLDYHYQHIFKRE